MDSTEIKAFWESQARRLGNNVLAVNFDPLSDDFCDDILSEYIPDGVNVADIGCGNGRNIIKIAQRRPLAQFVGFDYVADFIHTAEAARREAKLNNIRFEILDAVAHVPLSFINKFNIVYSKRLLINVRGDKKFSAIKNIHKLLVDRGMYIMIECFEEPLALINDIRSKLGLNSIEIKGFNEYLREQFLGQIDDLFFVESRFDVDSLYYFISRIFNASLSSGDPDYNAPLNQLAAKLVRMGVNPMQGYSPEVVHILRKQG